MKAVLDGVVIAEAPDTDVIGIEGNSYFPPSAVSADVLSESPTPYTCPWKGASQYFNVTTPTGTHRDAAWSYPDLMESAKQRVGRDFTGYVAFESVVEVG
jgi:uncharacterized protein (DUF427 family)